MAKRRPDNRLIKNLNNLSLFTKKYNDQPISEVLKELVQQNNWKAKLYQNRVKEIWLLHMGKTISSYTKEIRLSRRKLFIRIESAALRQELTMNKAKIIELMNNELEEEGYVQDVIVR